MTRMTRDFKMKKKGSFLGVLKTSKIKAKTSLHCIERKSDPNHETVVNLNRFKAILSSRASTFKPSRSTVEWIALKRSHLVYDEPQPVQTGPWPLVHGTSQSNNYVRYFNTAGHPNKRKATPNRQITLYN